MSWMLAAAVVGHGATGSWLDEFIELGLPLLLFIGLYFWQSRGRGKKKGPKA